MAKTIVVPNPLSGHLLILLSLLCETIFTLDFTNCSLKNGGDNVQDLSKSLKRPCSTDLCKALLRSSTTTVVQC